MIKNMANSFMAQRLIISGVVYLASLYMAQKMGATLYGNLAFIVFYIKSLPAMNLGLSYGLIYYSYKPESTSYNSSYIMSYLLIALLSLIIGGALISIDILLFGFILLAIFIIEPFLRIKKIFLFSLFPEFFLMISCTTAYLFWGNTGGMYLASVMIALLLLVGVSLYLNRQLITKFHFSWNMKDALSIKQIKELMLKGYTSYLYNLALFLFLFTDRYMLSKYYPGVELGVCMLAAQLCQASLFIMTSWNYSSLIEIGELFKEGRLTALFIIRKILNTGLVGLVPLIVFYCILLQIEGLYFKDYPDLTQVFVIIAAGLYCLNLATCITPILFFFEKQLTSALVLFSCVLITFGSYFWAHLIGGPYIMALKYNYLALAISSLFTIFYAFYVLNDFLSKKEILT